MAEVGFLRRVAPALILAAAGGVLLYLLPTGADDDLASSEDLGMAEGAGGASAFPSSSTDGTASGATGTSSGGPSSAPAASANATRVITGDAIDFRFGTLQVKVALEGTTITNIGVITAPGGRYQRYTDAAIPGMKAKILKAQSTQVSAVSGATYTSMAYAQSVQSALDRA